MRTRLALLATTTLLLPTAVLSAPAEAATAATSAEITNCSKTQYGVTVKIRIRYLGGQLFRVRISHQDGSGVFEEPKVKRTRTTVITDRAADNFKTTAPSFRVTGVPKHELLVVGKFVLKNDQKIHLTCNTF